MFLRATLIAAAAIATATIGLAAPANAENDCPPGYYPAASGDCVPYPARGPRHARTRPLYAKMATSRVVNTPTAAAHATGTVAFKRT